MQKTYFWNVPSLHAEFSPFPVDAVLLARQSNVRPRLLTWYAMTWYATLSAISRLRPFVGQWCKWRILGLRFVIRLNFLFFSFILVIKHVLFTIEWCRIPQCFPSLWDHTILWWYIVTTLLITSLILALSNPYYLNNGFLYHLVK